MKTKYTLFRRGEMFYMQDSATGQQPSLRTKDETEAKSLLRGLAKIKLPFMAQGFWPLAPRIAKRSSGLGKLTRGGLGNPTRERRASPAHGSVRSEQRSQRPKDQARMGKVILARPLSQSNESDQTIDTQSWGLRVLP